MECQDTTGQTEFPVCQENLVHPVNEEKKVRHKDFLNDALQIVCIHL